MQAKTDATAIGEATTRGTRLLRLHHPIEPRRPGHGQVQGTASAKPVFQSSGGPNTLPAVSFDGVDDYLELGAAWAQFRTPLTVMVVCSTMHSTASFQIGSAMNTDSIFDYQGKACHESSYNNWCVRNHQTAFGAS